MNIAIFGATSEIARDLIKSFAKQTNYNCTLFTRNPSVMIDWIKKVNIQQPYQVLHYSMFGTEFQCDAIVNFVGAGNPARAVVMGNSIFNVTLHFDNMVLGYLETHPTCRYLFLSSGAAYGSNFSKPANCDTKSVFNVNSLEPQDWYGMAKLHAECRHRSHPKWSIIDIRVFNYFSHTQDVNARFLITDILRAILHNTVLKTLPNYIVRDFLHPSDFYRLVSALLSAPAINTVVDCYTKAPIEKSLLLSVMQEQFGLRYEVIDAPKQVNATGSKSHYYSLNTRAADFGYKPHLDSLEGVLLESKRILNCS